MKEFPTSPNFVKALFSIETRNQKLFDIFVESNQLEPSQIIRPGDKHPITGKLFKDEFTGGPLETSSWVFKLNEHEISMLPEPANLNSHLKKIFDLLQPYQELLTGLRQDGSLNFDISWQIDSKFRNMIYGPLICADTWKNVSVLGAELGISLYQIYSEDLSDKNDEISEKESKYKIDFFEHDLNYVLNHDDKPYFSTIDLSKSQPIEEDMNLHLFYAERYISLHYDRLSQIFHKKKGVAILHRTTNHFSEGIIFSTKLISFLAQLNLDVLVIDDSLSTMSS